MTYSEKLKDPRWQKKRLEILSRDNFTCMNCSATDRELHVHHRYYVSGRNAWAYPDHAYQTLCFKCHEEIRNLPNKFPNCLFSWETLMSTVPTESEACDLTDAIRSFQAQSGLAPSDISIALLVGLNDPEIRKAVVARWAKELELAREANATI